MSKQYIDISKITATSPLVTSIISLHKKCKLKHREGCLASSCEECLSRNFNGYHNHLLTIETKLPAPSTDDAVDALATYKTYCIQQKTCEDCELHKICTTNDMWRTPSQQKTTKLTIKE